MSFFSPSRLSATAKIALFEVSPKSRRRRNERTKSTPEVALLAKESDHGDDASSTQNDPQPRRLGFASFLSPGPRKSTIKPHTRPINRETPHIKTPTQQSPEDHVSPNMVHKLKKHVSDLEGDIKMLDSHISNTEGEDTKSSKSDNVNGDKSKDEQLQQLKDKLCRIQQGLNEIEIERKALKDKGRKLEGEVHRIQTELENREREIASLSRRCQMQANKVKESTKLQSELRDFRGRVDRLENELSKKTATQKSLDDTLLELAESRKERKELLESLRTVTADRDAVEDNLRKCLTKLDRLMEEKQLWEAERQRLERRAKLDLDHQKMEHEQSTVNLQQVIKAKEQIVGDLQDEVRSQKLSIEETKQQLANAESRHRDLIADEVGRHKEAIAVLSKQHEQETAILVVAHTKDRKSLLSQIEDKEETISLLRNEVETSMIQLMDSAEKIQRAEYHNDMFDSLTANIEELESKRDLLADQLHEKETEVCELSATILKLEIENELVTRRARESEDLLSQQELELVRMTKVNAQLTRKLTEIQEEAAVAAKALSSRYGAKATGLQSRLNELENLCDSRTAEVKLKNKEIDILTKRHDQALMSADELHQQVVMNSERNDCMMKQVKSDCERQVADLRATIARYEERETIQTHQHNELLKAKEDTITSLTSELQTSMQEQEMLRSEARKARTTLAMKEDEMRDVKLIEMADRDEQIREVTNKYLGLKQQLDSKDRELLHLKESSEDKIKSLEKRSKERECRDLERSRNNEEAIKSLTSAILDQKNEITVLQTTIRSQERHLKEARADVAILSQRCETSQQNNERLKKEYQILFDSKSSNTQEKENLAARLGEEASKLNSVQRMLRESEQEKSLLKSDLEKMESKLVYQQDQMASLEEVLNERTKLLNDMVDCNKDIESKLAQKETMLSRIDQHNNEIQASLIEHEDILQRLRSEWSKKEEGYLEQLDEIRNRCEMAEADLEVAHRKMNLSQRESKGVSELSKENELLKDKIRRQEAFLKRKIEKDKVLRDRANTFRTPGRSKIPGPRPRSAIATRSTSTTASNDSSLDWEMDCFLQN